MPDPEPGSWHHYWKYDHPDKGFLYHLMEALSIADDDNRERIRRGFPQLVAALENRDRDRAPAGFAEPEYNAEPMNG